MDILLVLYLRRRPGTDRVRFRGEWLASRCCVQNICMFWALSTLLTAMFASRVALLMPPAVGVAVWAVAVDSGRCSLAPEQPAGWGVAGFVQCPSQAAHLLLPC
jgi:hypothetical protein